MVIALLERYRSGARVVGEDRGKGVGLITRDPVQRGVNPLNRFGLGHVCPSCACLLRSRAV
jgi:hypothetical protein